MVLQSPLIDYSNQNTEFRLKPNSQDSWKVTDGASGTILKVDTSTGANVVVMNTPTIDISAKATTIKLKDNTLDAYILKAGSSSEMMKISTDSASVANEKISFKSGGSIILDTPVIDHSNRAVNIKLANASVGALKISDALTDIFEISTDTWKTTGSTVKITTPTIDVTGDNTTFKVNSNSDSALSFSDGTRTMMNFATDPSLGNQKITLSAGASVGFETPMIDYSSQSTTFRLKSNVTDAWKITGLSCENGAYHTQTACETNGSWTSNVCSDSTNSFSTETSCITQGSWTKNICADSTNAFSTENSCTTQGSWTSSTCTDTANAFSTELSCTTQGSWTNNSCSDTLNAFTTAKSCTTQGVWSEVCMDTVNAFSSKIACTTNGTWNSGAGECSHLTYNYTTELACTSQGSWNSTDQTCNVTGGGREVNASMCTSAAGNWSSQECQDSAGNALFGGRQGSLSKCQAPAATWGNCSVSEGGRQDNKSRCEAPAANWGRCSISEGGRQDNQTKCEAPVGIWGICSVTDGGRNASQSKCEAPASVWGTCSVSEGGRQLTESKCEAPAAIWGKCSVAEGGRELSQIKCQDPPSVWDSSSGTILQVDTTPGANAFVVNAPKIDLTGKLTTLQMKDSSTDAFVLRAGENSRMMTITTDSSNTANENIAFHVGGTVIFDTPLIDYSSQAIDLRLKTNLTDSYTISDGQTNIIQISTEEWNTTGSKVIFNTPTIDVSGKDTTLKLKSGSATALSVSDGTNVMMQIKTDPVAGNQQISMTAGGHVSFQTPVIDFTSQATKIKLKKDTEGAWKVTDGASSETVMINLDTTPNELSLVFKGDKMEAIVPNVTLTSSQFVKFKTPVLDISNQDTVVTVNPSSDNALKIADLDGNTFLRMDTDTGQTGKPSDMFIGTTLHVQLPDVPNVGAGAYDVMKIHETELTLSSTNNAMLTSLHVDNMQLKGSQGVSLNMAATLYVDGSAIVPTDESSLSISGFNTSTTNYGLYVAGDTSYNQVRGKLFVKGGLYLGESNGTFTEISSSAFELTTGTDSSSNNVADKVVVTDDQKFVNVKNLNIIGTDSQLQLNSTLVEVGARELNYLKGITRGDYFSTTDDSENNNKVLRIRDYKVNTMPMTIYSWDSSVPDLKLTSRYAEITQEYSSGGRLDISSTNGLVRIEDVKFTGGVIEEVASIAFGGATKDSVYTTLQVNDPKGLNKTITLPDVSGTVKVTSNNGMTISDSISDNSDRTIPSHVSLVELTVSDNGTALILPDAADHVGHTVEILNEGSNDFELKTENGEGINNVATGYTVAGDNTNGVLVTCKCIKASGNRAWSCTKVKLNAPHLILQIDA